LQFPTQNAGEISKQNLSLLVDARCVDGLPKLEPHLAMQIGGNRKWRKHLGNRKTKMS
jgi:hypothetical protein